MTRRGFRTVVIAFALAVLLDFPVMRIILPFNGSSSMAYGYYLRLYGAQKLAKQGSLVQAQNPMPGYLGSTEGYMLKHVLAITEEGDYVLQGEGEHSYDSRYFGPLDPSYVNAFVLPLATSYSESAFTFPLSRPQSATNSSLEAAEKFIFKGDII